MRNVEDMSDVACATGTIRLGPVLVLEVIRSYAVRD